jgi:hypothetical protein
MSSSKEEIKWLRLIENRGANAGARTDESGAACEREKKLVSQHRKVAAAGRPAGSSPGGKKGEFEG